MWMRLKMGMASKDLGKKGKSPAGSESGRSATQGVSSSAQLSVLFESGVGPSTAARVSLLLKGIDWLASAQDDSRFKIESFAEVSERDLS